MCTIAGLKKQSLEEGVVLFFGLILQSYHVTDSHLTCLCFTAGDILYHNGSGEWSMFGGKFFNDESFQIKNKCGFVAMANKGVYYKVLCSEN